MAFVVKGCNITFNKGGGADFSHRPGRAAGTERIAEARPAVLPVQRVRTDRLVGRAFVLMGLSAADVADAEAAIIRLNLARLKSPSNSETLARLLLRSESVASSRIEGLEIGARRLLRAEAARGFRGKDRPPPTATEVLAIIDADGVRSGWCRGGGTISRDHLVEAHRRLLVGSSPPGHAGRTRTEQNWIGGSSFNPCSAVFVPLPGSCR